MWAAMDAVAVTGTLFLVYVVSRYVKGVRETVERKLAKAKSDKAGFLLDKLLTATLAMDRMQFAHRLPEMRAEIEEAKLALESIRAEIDADRSAAILAHEAALKAKSQQYAEIAQEKLQQEKEKIQESVDERRRERENTGKRIFAKAKEIDHFFRTADLAEGPSVELNWDEVLRNALFSKIGEPEISCFARHVFGVEVGDEAERLVTLRESEISSDGICRMLESLRPEQQRLKTLLTELLLEAVKADGEILFEALRVTRGDERLLQYINKLPLREILAQLKTSDENELVSLVLERFKAAIADKEELTALAEFCEAADFTEGGMYVDWHALDSASLPVCRRLTSAEKYAEMVKEVIKRQSQRPPQSPAPVSGSPSAELPTRQARKSIC